MAKIKILIVAPSRKMGGIERALSVLANEWAQQEINVVYLSCLKTEPFYLLNSKIKVIEPKFKRAGGIINKMLFYPRLLGYIRKEIRLNQPDKVLCFGDFFNPIVLLATKGLRIPVYISDRTSADFKFPFYIQILKQWMYPNAYGFIAQTQRAYEAKQQQFGISFNQIVIPNAIRVVEKIPVDRENIILYAGRFSWEKNPVALLEAFAQIKHLHTWRLVMAGDGPQWNKMKNKSIELGIEKQVDFLGAVSNLDLWLNKASIFVLPSVLEGFPNALCEAMTVGLPVICFDSIAYESIINPGVDGEIIPFGQNDLLSQKIEELILNENKRLKLGIGAKIKAKNWATHKIIRQYNQFLNI